MVLIRRHYSSEPVGTDFYSLSGGEEIAHFEYGGSAIYMLLPRSFPPVQWRLPMNAPLSEAEGVKLRSLLGEIVDDGAVADLGFESL